MMAEQALAGIKVLDLTHLIAGPYCTRMLAGYGAEVVKVERPGEGDLARHLPPFLDDEAGLERSGLFLYLNGNKKSITLNLKSPRGVEMLKELVRDADALVESFSPGVMGRLGLDYETLAEINPRLVVASISNFGQTGPYRDYKANNLITWGTGIGIYTDGYGQRPLQVGGRIAHYVAGLFATVGISAALYRRNEDGEAGRGQYLDISMQESITLISLQPEVIYDYTGQVHFDIGGKGYGMYPCKDGGYIGPNAWTLPQRERMFALMGLGDLLEDPRFADTEAFIANRVQLKDIIAEKLLEHDSQELFERAVEWGVPFSLVPTTREVLDSPQHAARGFFEEADHPVMGKVALPGAPFRMMATPWQMKTPAPLLGAQNEEIYGGRLGYSADDMSRFRDEGVI